MWDNDVYVLPAIVLFHPDVAKQLLRYRSSMADSAQRHATMMGRPGYRFPWESAFYGGDVTPDTCTECRDRALHVTAGECVAQQTQNAHPVSLLGQQQLIRVSCFIFLRNLNINITVVCMSHVF